MELARLQEQLDAAFEGRAETDVMIALAHTAGEFAIPKSLFDRLIDAFQQDQLTVRYTSFDELLGYCHNSADPVGEILLHLCGCHSAENVALSNDVCVGLQLVNFWQDVKRDYAIGRIYLPQETMTHYGVDEAMFASESTPQPLREAIRFECERASVLLVQGTRLASHVPRWFSRDVLLFAHGGLQVVRAIERIGYDVLRQRPIVSRRAQAALLLKALFGRLV